MTPETKNKSNSESEFPYLDDMSRSEKEFHNKIYSNKENKIQSFPYLICQSKPLSSYKDS